VPWIARLGHTARAGGGVSAGHLLGIDIGGTKLVVALGDASGRPLDEARLEQWGQGSAERDFARLTAETKALLARTGVRIADVRGIGVSAPGPLDPVAGVVIETPNLPGWHSFPLRTRLEQAFGIPVQIENDANAAALAEWRHGAGRGASSFAFLTMSTGVGAGFVLDGRLWRGHHFQAGEIGHMPIERDGRACGCGMRGCLEAYVGGAGLAARIREDLASGAVSSLRELTGGDPARVSARLWTRAIREGDPYALRMRDDFVARLSQGLAALVMILDPQRIALGTIVRENVDLFLEPVRAALCDRIWAPVRGVEVVAAGLGPRLPAYAALSVAGGDGSAA
jgi:glucokinase